MDGEILQQIPQGHTNELFLGNTPQIDGKNRNFAGAFTLIINTKAPLKFQRQTSSP